MNHFSARSIGLYILAIGVAIGFFQVVTSYGEANIKAPIAIAGNYPIAAPSLPGCLQHKRLFLRLQQSGIYLNASLTTDRLDTMSRPTFSGRLSDRQVNLSGILPATICPASSQLRIAGSIVKTTSASQKLQGQLWLTSPNIPVAPVDFTGVLQPSTQSSTR